MSKLIENSIFAFVLVVSGVIFGLFCVLGVIPASGVRDDICRSRNAWHHTRLDNSHLVACREMGTNDLFYVLRSTGAILVPMENSCRNYPFTGLSSDVDRWPVR